MRTEATTLLFVLFAACCSALHTTSRSTEHQQTTTTQHGFTAIPFEPYRTEIALSTWFIKPDVTNGTIYRVSVPNTVVGALVEANIFDFDPFYGKNIERFNKSDYEVPWAYLHTLVLGNPANLSAVLLKFDGINYRGNLTVNGHVVANDTTIVGAFRRYEFDVTEYLVEGDNEIVVKIEQSAHDAKEWRNNSTDLGISFDDWAPHPPDLSMGLWRPVSVVIIPMQSDDLPHAVTMDGLVVKTLIEPSDPMQTAFLNISVRVTCWADHAVANVWVDVGYPGVPVLHTTMSCKKGESKRPHWSFEEVEALSIRQPMLWWPWQMGAQNLFNASFGFVRSNVSVQLDKKSIGLRQVTTELTPGGALQFYVNNIPLLIRAGGWAPDLFLRSNTSRVWKEFALIRDMGMNGIRLEGKMEYDAFFEAANHYGMLILPGINCCDGWQNWPHWKPLQYKVAYHSMRDQAKRLGHHPSVAGFLIASDQLPPPNVERMYDEAMALEAWPNPIISSASQEPSTLTGPSGVKMVGPYSWEPPTYWLQDGNGLKDFNAGGAWGFFTEGGPGEAPMTTNSWKRTVPAEHLWNQAEGAMDSWWSAHMGCPWGHFRNLTYYNPPLLARYGACTSSEQYLYKSQAAVYEGIRAYFESYNRNKHKNATGFVQWMMNDALPTHLWHLYDWYLTGGGGYYAAKRSNEDLHAMMSYNDGSVWVINSLFTSFSGLSLEVEIVSQNGTTVWAQNKPIVVVPGDATLDTGIRVPMTGLFSENVTFFVKLLWYTSQDPKTKTNWYWLTETMDTLNFPASNGFRTPCNSWANFQDLQSLPAATVMQTEFLYNPAVSAGITLTNPSTSGTVIFMIHVHLVSKATGFDLAPQMWSDNFVSLSPGQSAVLTCDLSLAEMLQSTEVLLVVETGNDEM